MFVKAINAKQDINEKLAEKKFITFDGISPFSLLPLTDGFERFAFSSLSLVMSMFYFDHSSLYHDRCCL